MSMNVTFGTSAGSVEVFDPFEVTAAAMGPLPGVVNPFTDVTLAGEFTPENGETVTVEGFCDDADGGVFRVRFLPRTPGRHSYRVTLQHGDRTVAEAGGEFGVKENPEKNGPVRVDPEHPWHFVHEGSGRHFFYNGTTAYWLLGWDEGRIDRIIDRLADLGVNRIRVALSGRVESGRAWHENVFEGGGFSFKLNPWHAADPDSVTEPGFDVSRFHVPFWRKADRMLKKARERGVQVSVIFYVDGARKGTDPFGKENMAGEDERRYYRYAVARLAAHPNVFWDVTNEYRLFRDDDWARTMGRFLKGIDPYGHTTSVHGHGDFRFQGPEDDWADFAMYQSWDEHGGNRYMVANRESQRAAGRAIPQVNEEYGYEDHYPQGWGENRVAPARSADDRRRLAWEIAMAGGYQTTGERAEPCGGWINGNGCEDSTEMLAGNARIRRFFEAFEWWRCEPRNDLVTNGAALCLAEPGRQYALWLPRGGEATLALEPGEYSLRAFDPLSDAGFTELPPVSHAGGAWPSPSPEQETAAATERALLLVRTPGA